MALIQCKECGQMISDKAKSCPKCGCPVSYASQVPPQKSQFSESFNERKKSSPVIWLLLLLLIVIVGAIIYILVSPSDASKANANAADSLATDSAGQKTAQDATYELPQQKALPPLTDFARNEILSVVNEWNHCHNTYIFDELDDLYADRLFYYTKNMSKDAAIKDKVSAINKLVTKHGYFSQDCRAITIKRIDELTVRCDFTKNTSFGNNSREYHAYLEMQKFGDEWKITRESDTTTDKNVSKRK